MLATLQPEARGTRPATARFRRQLPFSRVAGAAAAQLAGQRNAAAAAALAAILLLCVLGPSLMARTAQKSMPAADTQRVSISTFSLAHVACGFLNHKHT